MQGVLHPAQDSVRVEVMTNEMFESDTGAIDVSTFKHDPRMGAAAAQLLQQFAGRAFSASVE
jgi:hypothetical protein